jgi:uncharacterized membrane protein
VTGVGNDPAASQVGDGAPGPCERRVRVVEDLPLGHEQQRRHADPTEILVREAARQDRGALLAEVLQPSLDLAGLVTFGLAFLLVANVWWHHHRILAKVAWLEPGVIALNLALLAGVALVPFPTSLVGADPSSRTAVLSFIGLFVALSFLSIGTILRTQRLGAWVMPIAPGLFRWVVADWALALSVLVGSFLLALAAPLVALGLLAVASMSTGLVMARLGPQERRALF